jgi:excisionase family DNA binding protein
MPSVLEERVLYETRDLTRRYGFHLKSWETWLRSGELEGVKVRNRWRISAEAVEKFLGSNGDPPIVVIGRSLQAKDRRAESKRILDEALDEFGELPTPAEALEALRKAKEAVDAKTV